jgi:hypothetical protein
MKKLKRILSIVMLIGGSAVVLGMILLLVSSCSTETDKYADYEIIDYNLTWIDTGWGLGSFTEEKDDLQIKYKYNWLYTRMGREEQKSECHYGNEWRHHNFVQESSNDCRRFTLCHI